MPSSYADAFAMLARHGVLDLESANGMVAGAGLRNRIARGYAGLDPARLLRELPRGLDALEAFARAVARYVERGDRPGT